MEIYQSVSYLTEHSSTCRPFHYINHVRGANGNWASSVITVIRIQAVGYQARKRGFCFVHSLQNGTEANIDFF